MKVVRLVNGWDGDERYKAYRSCLAPNSKWRVAFVHRVDGRIVVHLDQKSEYGTCYTTFSVQELPGPTKSVDTI